MKIVLYSINCFPDLTGIGKYTGEMAEWLGARGHEVRVVTAPPYYPAWEVRDGYSAWRYEKTKIDNLVIWRCPTWVPRQPTGLKRILHLSSFALSSLPVILRQAFWRPDVILVVEPPLFCAPMALTVAWLCRAKSWLHVQDFEVDAAFELGLLRSPFLKSVVTRLERWIMQRFDVVSTISDRMLSRLKTKGVTHTKCFPLVNWVDATRITPAANSDLLKMELGISKNSIVALYSGNMGEKQGLETVVEAARLLLNQDHITFVMSGQGASYARLRAQAANVNNIRWIPLQPLDRLGELLCMADIHLLPQRADVADLVMPSKLTGMLASGRPVVAGARAGTQVADVVTNAGLVVEPENSRALAQAVLVLSSDQGLRYSFGQAGREYAIANWDTETVLVGFERRLIALVQKCLVDQEQLHEHETD